MNIITNNQERQFLLGCDVPENVFVHEYEHLEISESSDNFIKYRGKYYHLSDFIMIEKTKPETDRKQFNYWDGYLTETAFSGILIKVNPFKPHCYTIARCYC